MRYFVTSDQHFGHGNIIKYANRPFKSAEEMNETMIKRWNERVKSEDTVFIIGDFCFKHPKSMDAKAGGRPKHSKEWLAALNGNKIIIRGNHDNNNSTKTIIDCIHITYAKQRINLVHKPEHANLDFPINLVGHVHNKWKFKEYPEGLIDGIKEPESILLNVGVDQNNFYPITLDEAISQIMKYKKGILK
jgi:calcineurin-like phosphoesterase family protein